MVALVVDSSTWLEGQVQVVLERKVSYLANLQVGEELRFTYFEMEGAVWLMAQRGEDDAWYRLNRVLCPQNRFNRMQAALDLLADIRLFEAFSEGPIKPSEPCCAFNLNGEMLMLISMAVAHGRWQVIGLEQEFRANHWVLRFEVVRATD